MAKRPTTPATPKEPALIITVIVRVTGERICENGIGYAKGETFETTADRAAALAGLVEIVTV
jgi:hypothetical protein